MQLLLHEYPVGLGLVSNEDEDVHGSSRLPAPGGSGGVGGQNVVLSTVP